MKFEILFDNGGGILLQVGQRGYVHFYDNPMRLSGDALAIIAGADARGWDNHQPEYRRYSHSEDVVVTGEQVRSYLRGSYRPQERGASEQAFWVAITPPCVQKPYWMEPA